MSRSIWGNPYKTSVLGRAGAVQSFREFVFANLEKFPLLDLSGRVLRCHCCLGQECHGDVLIEAWFEWMRISGVLEKMTIFVINPSSRAPPIPTPLVQSAYHVQSLFPNDLERYLGLV